LSAQLANAAAAGATEPTLDIDAALMASGATADVVNLLERAGPFGQGNAQPRFVFPAHRVKFAKVVGEAHIRVVLEGGDGGRLEAIAFRAASQPLGDALMGAGGMPLHVAGHLKRDTWGGREKIELQIDDVADPRKA
jgi:single-stranded-DNA-specific exonuclease